MQIRRRDRIRFALERFVLGGLGNRLLAAGLVVLGVSVTAGMLLSLMEGVLPPDEAVWWAFLRLTDPGYLGDDEGLARRVISTTVTVLGYLLFLGLLIAILTQWLNEMIKRLESGATPIALEDHVLVLGFNQRTPMIVRQLLETRNRVARFLARHGATQLRIVVLADVVDSTITRDLRERVGPAFDPRQVLLRAGSPLRLDHLERVSFSKAAVIIVPCGDHASTNTGILDAETVKTLRALSVHGNHGEDGLPSVVAELGSARSASVARSAYAGACETIAGDEVVGFLIAQSVIHPGIFDVLREILTLNDGNTIFLRTHEGSGNCGIDELQRTTEAAIVLGFVRAGERQAHLNPGPDERIEPGDLVVSLARHHGDCTPVKTDRPLTTRTPVEQPIPEPGRRRRVLVLGWSSKVPTLLDELALYGSDAFEVHIVSSKPTADRTSAIKAHGVAMAGDQITHTELSTIAIGVLHALEPESYDHIVMIASEQIVDAEQADAATVFAHQVLTTKLPGDERRPHVFVELLADDDLFLFDRTREDVIVSPTIASYLVSQVALRPELVAVFGELTRPWGSQIVLQALGDWLPDGAGATRFEVLERLAAERGQIALGVRLAEGDLELNPGRDAAWTLGPDDRIVTLTTFERPG